MTQEQVEQLRYALTHPRYTDWSAAPIVPGEWRDLEGHEALSTLLSVSDWFTRHTRTRNLALDWSIDRVRVRDLACYEAALLVEFQGHAGYGRPGLINVIIDTFRMALMDGESGVVHALNDRNRLQLTTPEGRADYLQLFMNWVHGDGGRFHPVGSAEELAPRLLPDSESGLSPDIFQPLREQPAPSDAMPGTSSHSVSVLYGTSLFSAVMHVYPTGMVEMVDESSLAHELPVRQEVMIGPLLAQLI